MDVTNADNQEEIIRKKIEKIFSPSESAPGVCPIKDVLDRFGDKWSIYAILLLGRKDKMRFNEIRNNISGISQRMLTVTLRSLEEDGLLERTIYAEVPPRVEYNLTALGKSLLIQMLMMAEWAKEHGELIANSRKAYEFKNKAKKTGVAA